MTRNKILQNRPKKRNPTQKEPTDPPLFLFYIFSGAPWVLVRASCRETAKTAIRKSLVGGNGSFFFHGMDFFPGAPCRVLNSPCWVMRNAQKLNKKNVKKKESTYLPHLVAIYRIYVD
jgi:hypothetical protein